MTILDKDKSKVIGTKWVDELIYLEDLIYFEGPLLGLLENEKKQKALFYWCDVDDTHNRWLICRILDNTLTLYKNGKLSLLNAIKASPSETVWIVDINAELKCDRAYAVNKHDLPELISLPTEQSYYYPKLAKGI